jgi:hypothetical protein
VSGSKSPLSPSLSSHKGQGRNLSEEGPGGLQRTERLLNSAPVATTITTAPAPAPDTDTHAGSKRKDQDPGLGGSNRGIVEMATDEEYAAFLDKVNQDPYEGVVETTKTQGMGRVQLKAVDEGVAVPQMLMDVISKGDAYYVSDADEPFEEVCLKFEGKKLPDEGELPVALLLEIPFPLPFLCLPSLHYIFLLAMRHEGSNSMGRAVRCMPTKLTQGVWQQGRLQRQ